MSAERHFDLYFTPAHWVPVRGLPKPDQPRPEPVERPTEPVGNWVPKGWKAERADCPVCGKDCAVRPDGSLYDHLDHVPNPPSRRGSYSIQNCPGRAVWGWSQEPPPVHWFDEKKYLAALTGIRDSLDSIGPFGEAPWSVDDLDPNPWSGLGLTSGFSAYDAHSRFLVAVARAERGIPFDLIDD